MPIISVIVPVYKVENYLQECIQSILKQSFSDFELILIDDGSPDNCGQICDYYEKKDERVKIIHQENQGLSGARNAGMDIAKGTYITFIDSDDVVSEDYLSTLYEAIRCENADMAVCVSCDFEDGNLQMCPTGEQPVTSVLDGKNAVIQLYHGAAQVPIGAIGKLFRRSIVSEMRFPVGRLHEDQAFIPIAYYHSSSVVFLNAQIYYYRVRTDSITHKPFSVKRYDDLWAIDSCIRFFESRNETEIVSAAKEKRQRLISTYAIYARRDNVTVPEEYRISIWKALMYLRKHVSETKYEYCLAQIYPRLAHLYEYEIKIRKILGISKS